MISWTKLTYGALVASGLALTGLTIYQGSQRRQIQPPDVIELLEGTLERLAATKTAPIAPTVTTNLVNIWVPAPEQYPVPNGTNAPIWTNYLAFAGVSNALVTTNINYGLQVSQTFRTHVGKFIWAGWDTLRASGFTDHGYDEDVYNGLWYRAEVSDISGNYLNVGDVIYTNSQDRIEGGSLRLLIDHGQDGHKSASLAGSTKYEYWTFAEMYFYTTNDTLQGQWFWVNDDLFATSDILGCSTNWASGNAWGSVPPHYNLVSGSVTPVGNINTNHIRNGVAYVDELQKNAVGIYVSRSLVGALDATIKATVPLYVDDSLMSNGTLNGWYAANPSVSNPPMLSVTGLWARLGIGDRTNKFTREPPRSIQEHTNWVYSYVTWWPNNTARSVCYTAQEWHAVSYASAWDSTNGYTWSSYSNAAPGAIAQSNTVPTYGDLPWQIYTNDLWERYRVLAALKVTTRTPSWADTVLQSNWVYELSFNAVTDTCAPAIDVAARWVGLWTNTSPPGRYYTTNEGWAEGYATLDQITAQAQVFTDASNNTPWFFSSCDLPYVWTWNPAATSLSSQTNVSPTAPRWRSYGRWYYSCRASVFFSFFDGEYGGRVLPPFWANGVYYHHNGTIAKIQQPSFMAQYTVDRNTTTVWRSSLQVTNLATAPAASAIDFYIRTNAPTKHLTSSVPFGAYARTDRLNPPSPPSYSETNNAWYVFNDGCVGSSLGVYFTIWFWEWTKWIEDYRVKEYDVTYSNATPSALVRWQFQRCTNAP